MEAAWAELQAAARRTDDIHPWLGLATIAPAVPPVSRGQVKDIRVETAARLARWTTAAPDIPVSSTRRVHDGPIRVGYLSAHFHRANYMKPVWGLVNHHDRNVVRLHLFADQRVSFESSGYVPHPADTLTGTGGLSCAGLADLIESAGIDLLVDLNGYGVPERLPLFLRRNAPVTVAWFNAFATSGLRGVDAIIGDPIVVPESEDGDYTERVIRLPQSYLTFAVSHPAPPVSSPPVTRGNAFTFGCLAPLYKITPRVLDVWAAILREAPMARLLLSNTALGSPGNSTYVAAALSARGVTADRVILRGPAHHYEYLTRYAEMDVALDTFPYSGGTTTMEALWQGVPVLTCVGDRWVSRTSESLLRYAGLSDWVAADVQAYVDRAVTIGSDPDAPDRLRALRGTLRRRLSRSPACDVESLARLMEGLYREMTLS